MTRLFLLMWPMLFLALPAAAQDTLAETYTQMDFTLDYPAGWQVESDATTDFVYLNGDDVQLSIYGPAVLAAYALADYNPDTLARLVLALNTVEADPTQVVGVDSTAAFSYRRDDTDTHGLLIARTFADGSVGLIDAFAPAAALEAQTETILNIATTFDVPPVPAPAMLVDYAAAPSQVMAELEMSGIIPAGGALVFAENYVFASGSDVTQPLAQTLSLADVVLAGTLTATPGTGSDSTCGLLARLNGEGSSLEVGIGSSGTAYVGVDGESQIVESGVDVTLPNRMLLLALGPRLLVYLGGELVADVETETGSGHFGLHVTGSGATCEASEVWVYRVPVQQSGACAIVAGGGAVNKRGGPGTQFEVAGVLDANATSPAIGQATGADGLVWWQLADGGWVREDVVSEQGSCRALSVAG